MAERERHTSERREGDERRLKWENCLALFPPKGLMMVIWGEEKPPSIHQQRVRSEGPVISGEAGIPAANIMIDYHWGLKQGEFKLLKMRTLRWSPF